MIVKTWKNTYTSVHVYVWEAPVYMYVHVFFFQSRELSAVNLHVNVNIYVTPFG